MQTTGWIIGGVMIIIIFLIIWLGVKSSKNLPKGVPINKLSSKQFKKQYG